MASALDRAVTINRSSCSSNDAPDLSALIDVAPAVLLTWDRHGACIDIQVGPRAVAGGGQHDSGDQDGATVVDGEVLIAALAGEGWADLVHPDDRERARALVRTALERAAGAEDGVRLSAGDRWAVLRVHRSPGGGASGVLVDASRSFGSRARFARLLETFNRFRREDDMIRAVLSEGVSLLGGHSATVHVLDEAGGELVLVGSVGVSPDQIVEVYGRLPADAPFPAVDAMRTGEPVVVRNLAERRERYPIMDEAELMWDPAFVVVPLYRATGEAFGVLEVGFPSEEALDDLDDRLLVEVAGQSALALDRAQLARVAERNEEQLAFLDALGDVLSQSPDGASALADMTRWAVPRLADWCAVRIAESAAVPQPVVGVAHHDPTKVELLTKLAERLPRDLIVQADLGDAFRTARPFVSKDRDPADVARQLGDARAAEALEIVGARAVVIFPLYARGRLIGALGFGNGPAREMRHDEFELAHAIAVRAAVLVDNLRLLAERSEMTRERKRGKPRVREDRSAVSRAGHAFISYVREDAGAVDRMQRALEKAGVQVWRDTKDLWPGQDWQARIRQAITEDSLVFIACFSEHSEKREHSFQHEELLLAVDQFRRRRPGDPWLIPVRLTDCSLPRFDLGAGRTLDSLQRVDLFRGHWNEGMTRIITVVNWKLAALSPR